jgi:antitoxin (DNA-binding transcriptional repressor) of toxin-antitoxin stability system
MTEQEQVNMRKANSQLAERACQGDKVVIVNGGTPYVDLSPHVDTTHLREPGRLKKKVGL